MESEQSNKFNERLNQWVASQGFWFQVRYSMSGRGSGSVVMFHLLRLAIRLLVLLGVVAIAVWVYLVKLPGTSGFQKRLKESIAAGLGANDFEMGGFKREQSELMMSHFVAEGGNQTFFSNLEARNVKCQMGLLSGVYGEWQPGVVLINQLDMTLNAGADDEKSAESVGDALFRDLGRLKLDTVEVNAASLRWGYSERTRGKIVGSHMNIQRLPDGWRLRFNGGTFSQTWLQQLEIVELVVVCTRAGVVFEKAEMKKHAASVSMDGVRVVAGQRPEVKGRVKISKLSVDDIVPPAAKAFIEGVISGDFRVFGSTNTTDGIGLEGKIVLDADNFIRLRERLYLLRALTEFDVFNNYRAVQFKEGSMLIKTSGGGMEVSEVQMKAGELMTLAGQMRVRFPTPKEAAAAVMRHRSGAAVPSMSEANGVTKTSKSLEEDEDFTLRRAARAAHKDTSKAGGRSKDDGTSLLIERMSQSFETRMLEEQAAERKSHSLIYEGQFQITLPPDTFDNVQALREFLPVDPQSGRIPLEVPIKGDIYSITFDQTEDLYLRGQRN
jgi:hypothetical protein